MTYGHRLEFGTFITPRSDAPQCAVDLAVRSEALGYDLVTFQDHPYQPALLDTWTLLSWVAARSSRIQLAGNVLNTPLRRAAVLARATASLDLLSGGRISLGLGAGAFWDAIEAMGGEKLLPGQAVAALEEAIATVRDLWDVGQGATAHRSGAHHVLQGAQRGPVPAHDVPIWLGAINPQMLRLTGREADGWLISVGGADAADRLGTGNKLIDEAAVAAGRDPREIRRLVNVQGRFSATATGFLEGPAEQWVADLLPLVVDHGVGTVILASDDEDTLEQFAAQVSPALREAAENALPDGITTRPLRRAAVRARRRPGLDYDTLPPSLADTAIEPGDLAYATVRSTYLRGGAPALVLRPRTTEEVQDAVRFAGSHPHLPLGVRSGGHGISGRSTNDGGIVIDLAALNAIEVVDPDQRLVRIGPGARWQNVAAALAPHGWALSSGDYGGVGVGGLATAGGIGFLSREHGLTIDHLREVEMVLADGTVVRADDQENPDLYWAVHGAGANFGAVTSFLFQVDEVGDVGWAQLVLDASDTSDFLQRWGAAVEAAPRDLTSFVIVSPPRRGIPMTTATIIAMVDAAEAAVIIDRLQPLAETAPMLDQQVVLTSYQSVITNAANAGHNAEGEPVSRSAFVEHITPEFAAAAQRLLRSGVVYFFQIRSVGGAVAPSGSAAHRARMGAGPRVTQYPGWPEMHTQTNIRVDISRQKLHVTALRKSPRFRGNPKTRSYMDRLVRLLLCHYGDHAQPSSAQAARRTAPESRSPHGQIAGAAGQAPPARVTA